MSIICFLLAIYASCFAPNTQSKPRNQTPLRDISKYDTIGPFVLGDEPAFERDYKTMGEIRSFIWQHWHGRHRGWLCATFYTVEGHKTVSKFFVEPDESGAWLLIIDSESMTPSALPRSRPKTIIRHEAFNQMDWVEQDCNINKHCDSVTERALQDPRRYRLLLQNRLAISRDLF